MGTSKTYTLDQYRDEREAQLARQKNAAIQNQNVSFEKLQKYLAPSEATARSGYSQGLSETALIAADNSRQRAIASAENDYNIAHTELMNKYRVEKKAEEDKLKAEADAERDERFDSIYSHVASGEWDTVDNLKAYIDANSEGLTDFQKGQLQSKLDYYTSNPDKKPGAAQDKVEADEDTNNRYETVIATMDNRDFASIAELEKFINENSEGLTDFQKSVIENKLTVIKNDPYWQKVEDAKNGIYSMDVDDVSGVDESKLPKTDQDWANAINRQTGENFTITIGENDYYVEFGDGVDLPGSFLGKVDDGGLIVVSDKLHIRYGNRFYLVLDRNASTSSSDYKQLMKIVKTVQ